MHTALRYYMQCTLIFDNTGIFSKQDEEILNAFLGTLAPLLQSSKLFRRSVLQTTINTGIGNRLLYTRVLNAVLCLMSQSVLTQFASHCVVVAICKAAATS
jgi:hypothetical protein